MSTITINPDNGQHTATLSQRELATLRVIADHLERCGMSISGQRIIRQQTPDSDALRAIAGDCGDDNCEACSLDGDDASDARAELYGE